MTAEDLGGAMTHNSVSGNVHFMANDEIQCLADIRTLLSYLPSNSLETAPVVESPNDINRQIDELDELIPDNPNKPYNILDVILPIVDHRNFMEYQPYFAKIWSPALPKSTENQWGLLLTNQMSWRDVSI